MTTTADDISTLGRKRRRSSEPLGSPQEPQAIPTARGIGTPVAVGTASTQDDTVRTPYSLTSSDGLFTLEGFADDDGVFYVTES